MRTSFLLGAAAFVGLVAADPAFCLQSSINTPPASQISPAPGEPSNPDSPNPAPVPDPSQPNAPLTDPLPPEMPMPAGEAQQIPPSQPQIRQPIQQGSTDAPVGPMATPPSSGSNSAQSGGTTSSMLTPRPTTKEYPLCTRELQDNCRNPGEGPKATRKRNR